MFGSISLQQPVLLDEPVLDSGRKPVEEVHSASIAARDRPAVAPCEVLAAPQGFQGA